MEIIKLNGVNNIKSLRFFSKKNKKKILQNIKLNKPFAINCENKYFLLKQGNGCSYCYFVHNCLRDFSGRCSLAFIIEESAKNNAPVLDKRYFEEIPEYQALFY